MMTSAQQFRIQRLLDYPEHIAKVEAWLFDQWGSAQGEAPSALVGLKKCPPTLLALANQKPVAVLGFTRFLVPGVGKEELWINSLFVQPAFRGQGLGARLLTHGVSISRAIGADFLYVYTDIPQFYQRVGWRRFSNVPDTAMHILRRSL